MLSPASPPGPALGPALREGLKLGPGPSPTFKARARPELVFLGPDPSLAVLLVSTHIVYKCNVILPKTGMHLRCTNFNIRYQADAKYKHFTKCQLE